MDKLSMRKINEILRQRYELKNSYRDIARSLNISISTVADHLTRAKIAGITWPLPDNMSEQDLHNAIFLPAELNNRNRPLPSWEKIYKELRKKGVTLHLLWHEYRSQLSNGVCYSQFCHCYHKYLKTINPVMRQIHKAGEKAFVDYSGMKLAWIDKNGELIDVEIFVGCLGASQLIYIEATVTQQLPDWISSHINMFEYFGGVPKITTPDNLLSGVSKPHRYDPDINANYQRFAEYYGTAIVPARAAMPKDKAKAENAVKIVEMQILAALRNRTFFSISEINAELKARLQILNNQPLQKMKISRRQLFEEIDKPALLPLPQDRYQYIDWKKAKINIDYHFVFADHYYSVPYKYVSKGVEICANSKTVECFCNGERIATHSRSYQKHGYSTVEAHMPKAHQEQAKCSIVRLKSWASKLGNNTEKFIEHLINSRALPEQAYRACLGVLRLGDKYGERRLEKACEKALLVGAKRYKEVENILKNNLEEVPTRSTVTNTPLLVHANIRGADFYQ